MCGPSSYQRFETIAIEALVVRDDDLSEHSTGESFRVLAAQLHPVGVYRGTASEGTLTVFPQVLSDCPQGLL